MQEDCPARYGSIDGLLSPPLTARRWERTAEAGETVVGEGGPTQAVVGDILGQRVHRHIPAGTMAELRLRAQPVTGTDHQTSALLECPTTD